MKFVHIGIKPQVSSRTATTAIAMSSTSMPMSRNTVFFLLSIVFMIGFYGGKYREHAQKTSVPLFVRNGINTLIYNVFPMALARKEY